MCLYNFQLAIQHSNKHLWWSSLVQQLTVWHQELHLRCLWESWICYYFTLQKFILESAFDKLETMYKLETKCKHSFLYKKITKVISKKFRLGCCFENVQRKTCGNRFYIGYPIPLNKHMDAHFNSDFGWGHFSSSREEVLTLKLIDQKKGHLVEQCLIKGWHSVAEMWQLSA